MNIINSLFIIVTFTLLSGLTQAAEIILSKEQLANANLEVTTVTARESSQILRLPGTLMSDRRKSYRVAPVVEGMVIKLLVVEHERVSKGQVLARLRSNTLGQAQADYLEAQARFHLSEAERERIEGLWKDGAVAESRWLKVDSEYKRARASLEQRRRLLSLTGLADKQIEELAKEPDRLAEFDLTSPVNGIVMRAEIESGQLLEAGEVAFHVDDLSTLWAEVRIPVSSLAQVEIQAEAVIEVRVRPEQPYHGRLLSLGGEVDIPSQTLGGRIVVENSDGLLRPGMYAQVTLKGLIAKGLMAPASAIFQVGEQFYVFKALGKGRFEPVKVKIGLEAGGSVPILEGLAPNVEVVSSGVAELKSHWLYLGGE